jgi:hypothetical protein
VVYFTAITHKIIKMIKIKTVFFIIVVLASVAFYSCTKNSVTNAPYASYGIASNEGLLKIIYASAYTANPAVRLKINGEIVSNAITGRTPFPGGGFNTTGSNYPLYLSVPQGSDTVTISIVKANTNVDSVVLYKTVINLPDNSPYTLHITDTLVNATTNNTSSLLVKNIITHVDSGFARYRFVNLMPNVTATNGAVDLYLNSVKVASNIAYKQASDTFSLRIGRNAPGVTDTANVPTPTWTIRPAGAAVTTAALATYASTNTMTNQRVYTIFSMGYAGLTGTRLPYVAFTLDKNNEP